MDWFDVLKAARNVGSKAKKGSAKAFPFTAARLAVEAGFEATGRSKATDIAAGWISKLVRWGYVRRAGKVHGDPQITGGRPQSLYELTKWGLEKEAPKRKYWQPFKGIRKPKRAAANPEE